MTANSRSDSASSTSIQRTTTRYWRRTDTPRPWWPWGLLPLIGLVFLFLFGAAITAPAIEAEVGSSVGRALDSAGINVNEITTDGQRVTARVAGAGPGEAFVAGLAEATKCETWAGTLTCPTRVALEVDPVEAVPAVAAVQPQPAEVDAAEATAMSGSAAVPALADAADAGEECNRAFDDVLSNATIRFQTASATIDAGNDTLLRRLASLAESCPGRLTIEGHTDSRGDAGMNEALSLARASAVRDALVQLGIEGERMNAVGYGETQPVADNATSEGRARNRRIAIVVDSNE